MNGDITTSRRVWTKKKEEKKKQPLNKENKYTIYIRVIIKQNKKLDIHQSHLKITI